MIVDGEISIFAGSEAGILSPLRFHMPPFFNHLSVSPSHLVAHDSQ